eukprot:SAG31_NODE_596_length_13674_cov_3.806409_2_plen_152_part_00
MLASKLTEVDGSLVFLGMGTAADGAKFARKLRLDPEQFPILVDDTADLLFYRTLALRNERTLSQVYAKTVNMETFMASFRALFDGQMPTYYAGGNLTQLGGTFVFAHHNQTDAQEKGSAKAPVVAYARADTHSGNHAPIEEVVAAISTGGP